MLQGYRFYQSTDLMPRLLDGDAKTVSRVRSILIFQAIE